jgi:hypothetical protein
MAIQIMGAGEVIYFDAENGPKLVAERRWGVMARSLARLVREIVATL